MRSNCMFEKQAQLKQTVCKDASMLLLKIIPPIIFPSLNISTLKTTAL